MSTAYTVRIPEPHARRIEVEVSLESRGATELDLRLPVWTPGSYLVREHQRHVDGLTATDPAGRALPVSKLDKNTWRVGCGDARAVRVQYRLHCFELSVRTNHVDAGHAFLNPGAALMFGVGREEEPCTVRLQLPPGWRTWVALADEDGVYRAEDYDELADSPFELGPSETHESHVFEAQGVQHEIVVWGRGDFDAARVLPDLRRIVDAEAALFGGLPYRERYLFILHLNDRGRGGLEHRRSCALIVPRFSFVQKAAYENFLELVAHEFFHLWNVKRIRPQAFVPYDWSRENHTQLLWAMEGLTSTYEVMMLRRAGLIPAQRFLEIWAERLTQLARTPGRRRTSLAQASFDAWIKQYRPDESTAQTTVSYYLKGSVVGFLLDLELRRRTSGRRSLDDVLRLVFERHGRGGLPESGVEDAAVEICGDDSLRAWFDRAIRSTEELLAGDALAGVGLELAFVPARSSDDKGGAGAALEGPPAPVRGWLGAQLRERAGALEVSAVHDGSPAQFAGLCAGDELVALDGFRGEVQKRVQRLAPGRSVRLTVFRMDELLELEATPAEAPPDTALLRPSAQATDAQRALRSQWLGGAWPEDQPGGRV